MTQDSAAESRARAPSTPSPWRTFSLLALIEFVVVLDTSIVNVALPSIQRDLDFSATGLAWVVDGYLLTFAGFLLLGGRVADVVGRRRLFLLGLAVFTVASLTNALAGQDWHLVVSRLAQGIGGALVVPAALALITDLFDDQDDRSKALGIFSGMGGVAAAIGVVAGGLLTAVSWHWVFLINVPVGLALFVIGMRMLPAGDPGVSGEVDVLGAVSGTGGLFMLILGVIRGSEAGWGSPSSLSVFIAAALLLMVFVVRQRLATAPMIPTPLLKRRGLVFGNVVMTFVGTLMFGTFFIITLYMQNVRGLSAWEAGLLYVPIPVAIVIGTQLAPRLALRFGPHNSLAVGLIVQAGGLAWWAASVEPEAQAVTQFLAPTVAWGLGVGLSIVSTFIVCTMGAEGPMAGAASGLATTSQNAGGAIGLAGLVAIAGARTEAIEASASNHLSALTDGFALALWCAAGLAILGLALTRATRQGHRPSTQP